jgi:hypothetical protein
MVRLKIKKNADIFRTFQCQNGNGFHSETNLVFSIYGLNGMSTDHIPGIYNYCDRWCERCAFTARCLVFDRERQYFGDKAEHDLKSDAFWKTMSQVFSDTKTMILKAAEAHGIDLNDVDQEELDRDMKAMAKIQRDARKHPLVVGAMRYAKRVDKWFKENEPSFKQKSDDLVSLELMQLEDCDPEADAISITDARDVIHWYFLQIGVKFARALSSDAEREAKKGTGPICAKHPSGRSGKLDLSPFSDEDAMQTDMLGSAKVALLGIDRSIAGWSIMHEAFPDLADEILDILVDLDKLRRAGDARFPDARAFIRPGLDG